MSLMMIADTGATNDVHVGGGEVHLEESANGGKEGLGAGTTCTVKNYYYYYQLLLITTQTQPVKRDGTRTFLLQ